MIPVEFIKRLKTQKYVDAGALIKALGQPSPVSIRINPSKWRKTPSEFGTGSMVQEWLLS